MFSTGALDKLCVSQYLEIVRALGGKCWIIHCILTPLFFFCPLQLTQHPSADMSFSVHLIVHREKRFWITEVTYDEILHNTSSEFQEKAFIVKKKKKVIKIIGCIHTILFFVAWTVGLCLVPCFLQTVNQPTYPVGSWLLANCCLHERLCLLISIKVAEE